MARPLIALLTDFGLADHYVGAMKGVLLSLCRDATLVDITHDVPAHDVLAGALALGAAADAFPVGTVFLAVVDPGVGTTRRGLAARIGSHLFVGPDNGLLTMMWQEAGGGEAVELAEPRFQRPVVSRTFEGRDRFAPAAAWLARGTALEAFGPVVPDPVLLDVPDERLEAEAIAGEVISVDRFGNLVTSIRAAVLEPWLDGRPGVVDAGGRTIGPIVTTYADVAPRAPCALIGSCDRLELACNGGSARDALGLDRGAAVRVRRAD
jgi:S-adenosylmethionine hydrolase